MKLLITFSLIIVVLSQLCSAADDITKDKRYPLFNLISTKANIYTTNELLEYGKLHSDLWPEYNAAIGSNEKADDFKEFSKLMVQLIEVLKKLEKDKNNCDFQKDTLDKFNKLYATESATKWRNFDKVQKREQQMKTKDLESLTTTLLEVYTVLPAAIQSFVQGLDDKEKKQYDELFKSCEAFLVAKGDEEKYLHFSRIVALFRNDDLFKVDLCKAKALADFELKLVIHLFQ